MCVHRKLIKSYGRIYYVEIILFFGITGFFAYNKSLQMVENGKSGPLQALIAYYSILAIVVSIGGVIKFLFF
tara:strand:+ start:159 stop:374 length:216 start_codon:yes stop_codon:yes gene_type:complete